MFTVPDKDLRRFAAKPVARSSSGCLEWLSGRFPAGYGAFYVGGRNVCAHRIAWVAANGDIPDDACVLHRCDNRRCVAPEHLFIGTRGDNARDMCAKGRSHSQGKTCCPAGHPFAEHGRAEGKRGRVCLLCRSKRRKAQYWKDPVTARARSLAYHLAHRDEMNTKRKARSRAAKGRLPSGEESMPSAGAT